MKKIFVDIDETIATDGNNLDYTRATPLYDRIAIVNRLYEEGHHITYYTGRGASTGISWKHFTQKQLLDWGCKYHELICGVEKNWDLFIDDKNLNSSDLTYDRIKEILET